MVGLLRVTKQHASVRSVVRMLYNIAVSFHIAGNRKLKPSSSIYEVRE